MSRRIRNILLGIPYILATIILDILFALLGILDNKFYGPQITVITYTLIVLMPMYVWYDLHSKLNSSKRWSIFIAINFYFLICFALLILDINIIKDIKYTYNL